MVAIGASSYYNVTAMVGVVFYNIDHRSAC